MLGKYKVTPAGTGIRLHREGSAESSGFSFESNLASVRGVADELNRLEAEVYDWQEKYYNELYNKQNREE